MSFKSHVFRAFFSLFVILSLSVGALADTIKLKDGSTIKGKIVGFAGGKFTIAMGNGARKRQMTFAADEIESIEFDAPQEQHVATLPASVPRGEPVKKEPAAVVTSDPDEGTADTAAEAGYEQQL
jgi:hypothetical protein